MKFAIDTLGGDNAPQAVFDGAALALKDQPDLNLVMVGKKAEIEKFIADNKIDPARIEIIEADEAVLNTDHPATFLKEKPNCSLAKGFDALRTREDIDAYISAGPTGAILTGAIFRIGRIQGISRPALMATIPTRTGKLCRIMDVGANMDCKPEYLVQFAHMASTFLSVIGVENPRIGLLNVGAEEGKGNEQAKEVYNLLKVEPGLNFVGNVEADHVVNGEADAIIADGFSGNVFIKSLEGGCYYVSDLFKKAVSGNFIAKIGALFQLKGLKAAKVPFDYAKKACAPLLGVKRVVVKVHGKGDSVAFRETMRDTRKLVEGKLIEKIQESVAQK